jgi:hypothetical protein
LTALGHAIIYGFAFCAGKKWNWRAFAEQRDIRTQKAEWCGIYAFRQTITEQCSNDTKKENAGSVVVNTSWKEG